MKYLTFVKGPEVPMNEVPPEMFAVMEKYTAEQAKKGVFISGGGLAPSAQSFRVAIRSGKLVVTDGPFIESKEVIGGWAFVSHDSHEAALAGCEGVHGAARQALARLGGHLRSAAHHGLPGQVS